MSLVWRTANRELVPGARGIVRFESDPGWFHERIFLCEVSPDEWVVYTPGNHLYIERLTDYAEYSIFRGAARRYPRGARQVVSFSRPLEMDEMKELLVRARTEASLEAGRPPGDFEFGSAINWRGRPLAVPAPSAVSGALVPRGSGVPGADDVGGTSTPADLEPEHGHVWLISSFDGVGAMAFGSEVRLGEGSVRVKSYGVYKNSVGEVYPVEMVKLSEVVEWRSSMAARARVVLGDLGGRRVETAGLPSVAEDACAPPRADPAAGGDEGEDLRTCWIDVDEAGIRYKEWRKVVLESTQESFRDSSLRGPSTCLEVCRKMQHHGGNPRLWFAEWARETNISKKDRAWHEVKTLIDTLYLAGTFDQVNMGALACLEVVARRLLQYVEAYAHGSEHPNWNAAKHIGGGDDSLSLMPEEMRTFASKLSREEAELESLRQKAKAPHAGATPGGAASAAGGVLAGGLPGAGGDDAAAGGGGGRGRGRSGGRGRGTRPPPT